MKILDRVIKIVLFAMVVAMLTSGFMQILFRYVLKQPLPWSEELIRYLFVWITFLAVPLGVESESHSSIDTLAKMCPDRFKKAYQAFVFLLVGLVFVIMIVYGTRLMIGVSAQRSPAMRIRMSYVVSALPVSGVLGVIYTAKMLVRNMRGGNAA